MTRNRPAAILALALLHLPAATANAGGGPAFPVAYHRADFVERYREHVTTLANPFFEGRAPGTRGIEIAAEYIEFYFRQFGLEPAFPTETQAADGTTVLSPHDTFRQTFEFGSTTSLDHARASIRRDGSARSLAHGRDFTVLPHSGTAAFSGSPVFVGYSIASGPDDYFAYAPDDDLSGRAALILRFEPMDDEGRSRWTERGWTFAAALDRKITAAARRGASAIVLVTPPDARDDRVGRLETIESLSTSGSPLDIPVVMVTPAVADELIRAGDPDARSLADLVAAANEGRTVIDLPGVTLDLDARVRRDPILTDNVGAVLRGRGTLEGEYLVIGAHYDHVGYGRFGSRDRSAAGRIHPGADDNASGTAGVLLVAEKLRSAYADLPDDADARSVLFLAFTAEESGLIGSRYYVERPIAPIGSHYLMINLDMIGRLIPDRGLEVGGVGTGEGLRELVGPHFDDAPLTVLTSLSIGAGRSDHASFDARQVPNLFFFTGIHEDYHLPGDVSARINIEGAVDIVELVTAVALDAATRDEPLEYIQTRASRAPRQSRAPQARVRVGIAPGDYSGQEGGILIAQVFDGTSADEAGLRPGDRIVRWNDHALPDVEAWMPLLVEHEPGDLVRLRVHRDGEEIDVEMTLQPRGSGG